MSTQSVARPRHDAQVLITVTASGPKKAQLEKQVEAQITKLLTANPDALGSLGSQQIQVAGIEHPTETPKGFDRTLPGREVTHEPQPAPAPAPTESALVNALESLNARISQLLDAGLVAPVKRGRKPGRPATKRKKAPGRRVYTRRG